MNGALIDLSMKHAIIFFSGLFAVALSITDFASPLQQIFVSMISLGLAGAGTAYIFFFNRPNKWLWMTVVEMMFFAVGALLSLSTLTDTLYHRWKN